MPLDTLFSCLPRPARLLLLSALLVSSGLAAAGDPDACGDFCGPLPMTFMADFDGDLVPDDMDVDDDNDGILDVDECGFSVLAQIGFEGVDPVPDGDTQANPRNNFKSDFNFLGTAVVARTTSPDFVADMTNSPWFKPAEGASYAALQGGQPTPPHSGGDGLLFSISASELTAAGAQNGDDITVSFLYAPGYNYDAGGRAAEAGSKLNLYYGNGTVNAINDLNLDTATPTDEVTVTDWQDDGTLMGSPIMPANTFQVYNGVFTYSGNDIYFFVISINTDGDQNGDYIYFDDLKLVVSEACANTDSQGDINSRDRDADGDGCDDVLEAGHADPDGDGILGTGTPTVDANGRVLNAGGYTGPSVAVTDDQDVTACNQAPTVTCQAVTVNAGVNCLGTAVSADFVATSNDPDDDQLTFTVSPAGPYPAGTTNVTVTADDQNGGTTQCMTTITVNAPDFDGDLICDAADLDDDNDGILDEDECLGASEISFEFNGTFGTIVGVTSPANDPSNFRMLQNPVPGYSFGNTAGAIGTYYVNSGYGAPALHATVWPDDIRGHTTGTIEDAFLSVNGGTTQGVFFRETVTLSPNTDYEFGAWVNNPRLDGGGGPNVGLRIRNALNATIADITTGPITDGFVWKEYKGTFNSGSDTEFTIELFNISVTAGGNDFSIDDIFFRSDVAPTCANATDYDSDGDGCNDVLEAGFADGDDDGQLGTDPVSVDAMGRVQGHPYTAPNSNFLDANITSGCNGAPTLTCAPYTVNADGNCMGAAAGADFVATSNDPDGDVLTFTVSPAGPYGIGTTNVTVTADDDNGGTATCTTTVTVVDNTLPTANCKPFTAVVGTDETATVTPQDIDDTSTDNCGITNLSLDLTSFTCDQLGDHTVTLTVTDAAGNSDDCTATVTVTDAAGNCCDIAFSDGADPNPPAIITTRVICEDDGTITVNATCGSCDNGIEYSADGINFQDGNVITGLDAGEYTVTIRDKDRPDCAATMMASIGMCVGELPGNGQDDNCNGETDELSTVAWILLDAGNNGGCTSNTDCCQGVFCYGLEYTPLVSGKLTSYTTGFVSDCVAGGTPLISNASCVLNDNSFDAADCGGADPGIFFNSSGNSGGAFVPVDLVKTEPIILHQICLQLPPETALDLIKDDITDITMSITVPAVVSTDEPLLVTDRPDYVTATAEGNQRPVLTAGTIDDCYETVAEAEAAAILASSVSDDCTGVRAPILSAATDGTCNAVITVTAADQCDLTSTITYTTRIDGDAPAVTGALAAQTIEACTAADVPAATTVAALEALGEAGFDVSDNCTADADLVVTFDDSSVGSCPTTVTRTYTITDECGRASTAVQTLTLTDETAPTVSGSLTTPTVDGCDADDAPAAAATVTELLALDGSLQVSDNCTDLSGLSLGHTESINDACPRVLTRIYTVSDACGNGSLVIHQINIQDVTAPEATGSLDAVSVEGCSAADAPAPKTTVADLIAMVGDLAVSDNCTDATDLMVTSEDTDAAGTCPTVRVVTRTYTITDRCGLSVTVDQTININDTTAPVVVGSPETVEAEGCDASAAPAAATTLAEVEALTGVIDISDACTTDAALNVTHNDVSAPGTCPNVLVITRTYTVTDACANSVTLVQTINITDRTAPAVAGTATTTTVEGCFASDAPAAVDNVADLEGLGTGFTITDACADDADLDVTHADAVGTGCPIVITRTYTITDPCGNAATTVHTIEVQDTEAPDVMATGTIAECYTDRAIAEAAALAATGGSDNCGGDVTYTVASAGTCTAIITVTGTDACGNPSTVDFTTSITGGVAPTEVGGPLATNVEVQTTLDVVTPTPPVFRDVCGNDLTASAPVIDNDYVEGECSGTISYTYTYVDCAGTEATWVFTYLVDCRGLELRIFPEGSYNAGTGMLDTDLNVQKVLPGQDVEESPSTLIRRFGQQAPFGQPYGGAPWNYSATAGDTYGDATRDDAPANVTAYPAHVVDWVLVTVRENTMQPSGTVWQCTGWVHENGEVTFPDACPLTLDPAATYYVVVEHRNHLAVLDEATLAVGGAYLAKDFTAQNSFAPRFRFGQKEVAPGVWVMFAGNGDQTTSRNSINSSDRTLWRNFQGFRGYNPGDHSNTGVTGSGDETIWKNNQNKTSGIRFN